jgi:hypothetical protein
MASVLHFMDLCHVLDISEETDVHTEHCKLMMTPRFPRKEDNVCHFYVGSHLKNMFPASGQS